MQADMPTGSRQI